MLTTPVKDDLQDSVELRQGVAPGAPLLAARKAQTNNDALRGNKAISGKDFTVIE